MTSQNRKDAGPKERILRAAELILEKDGHAAITTRRLATTADVNQALVHYYFGSVGEVMLSVLDRIGIKSDEQARQAFAGSAPDVEKWRAYFVTVAENEKTGFAKRWFETMAMAANDEEMKARVGPRFHGVMTTYESHLDGVLEAIGISPTDSRRLGLAAFIQAAIYGMLLEVLVGYDRGHDEMLKLVNEILRPPVETNREKSTKSSSSTRSKASTKKKP